MKISPDPFSTALVPGASATPLDPAMAGARVLALFLTGRSPHTWRAYRCDVQDFAHFVCQSSGELAAALLLSRGPGPANALALAYRADLQARGLSAATVNRRLAALRSLVKLARTLGMVSWGLEVPGLRTEAYRDTAGPGKEGVRKLLTQVVGRTDAKGLRDRAIVRLAYDLGLRRKEIVGLDVEDLDLPTGTAAVLGKGRTQKTKLTLPAPTREALDAWLGARGSHPGPVFVRLDRAKAGHGRLDGSSVYRIIRALGERAGIRARPHGLRHTAITELLELTGGNVRQVREFSRHASVQTVLRYDDNRQDRAGQLAGRLARDLGPAA
jgi:integrase/recombinase XerC